MTYSNGSVKQPRILVSLHFLFKVGYEVEALPPRQPHKKQHVFGKALEKINAAYIVSITRIVTIV